MAPLTDRIDRFVRWFFNSSPDQTSIEPRLRDAETPALPTPVSARHRRATPPVPGPSRQGKGKGSHEMRVQA